MLGTDLAPCKVHAEQRRVTLALRRLVLCLLAL